MLSSSAAQSLSMWWNKDYERLTDRGPARSHTVSMFETENGEPVELHEVED